MKIFYLTNLHVFHWNKWQFNRARSLLHMWPQGKYKMFINHLPHSRAGKKGCFISNKILFLKPVFLKSAQIISRSESPHILNTGNTSVKLYFYVFLNKCGFSLRTFYHEFQFQLSISFCSSGISNSLFFQLFLKCRKLRRLLSYLKWNMAQNSI